MDADTGAVRRRGGLSSLLDSTRLANHFFSSRLASSPTDNQYQSIIQVCDGRAPTVAKRNSGIGEERKEELPSIVVLVSNQSRHRNKTPPPHRIDDENKRKSTRKLLIYRRHTDTHTDTHKKKRRERRKRRSKNQATKGIFSSAILPFLGLRFRTASEWIFILCYFLSR